MIVDNYPRNAFIEMVSNGTSRMILTYSIPKVTQPKTGNFNCPERPPKLSSMSISQVVVTDIRAPRKVAYLL